MAKAPRGVYVPVKNLHFTKDKKGSKWLRVSGNSPAKN